MNKITSLLLSSILLINSKCYAFSIHNSIHNIKSTIINSDLFYLFNAVFSLLIVIVLIYITAYLYKKLGFINQKKFGNLNCLDLEQNKFNILSSISLGANRNLYAIGINKKILVIAATTQNITLVKEIDLNNVNKENVNLIKSELKNGILSSSNIISNDNIEKRQDNDKIGTKSLDDNLDELIQLCNKYI